VGRDVTGEDVGVTVGSDVVGVLVGVSKISTSPTVTSVSAVVMLSTEAITLPSSISLDAYLAAPLLR
jgi:hypothetical protein